MLIIVMKQTHALDLANLQSKPVLNLKMESVGRWKAWPSRENIIILAEISGGRKSVLDLLILLV